VRSGICLLVAALVLTSCGRHGDARAVPVSKPGPPGGTAQVDLDFIPSQFPATSAEFENPRTFAWLQFVSGVEHAELRACMQHQGFSPDQLAFIDQQSGADAGALVDNVNFPDLARLASGSFGTSDSGPPVSNPADTSSPHVAPSEQAAFDAGLQACSAKVHQPFDPVDRALRPIQLAWASLTDKLPADPTVAAATVGWRACMHRGGVVTSSLTDFFGQVDALGLRLGAHPNETPQMQQMARLYGRCVTPLSQATDAARQRDRKQLLDRSATQLDAIQQQMSELVAALSARYGVRFASSR